MIVPLVRIEISLSTRSNSKQGVDVARVNIEEAGGVKFVAQHSRTNPWMKQSILHEKCNNEKLNLGVRACGSLRLGDSNLGLRIWTSDLWRIGACSLRRNDGDWSANLLWGILGHIGRCNLGIVNDLSVLIALGIQVSLCNVLGPDISISTRVLPDGHDEKENVVEHHCYVQEKKNQNIN